MAVRRCWSPADVAPSPIPSSRSTRSGATTRTSPNLQPDRLNVQRNGLPRDGSDIYRIHLGTRVIERLTHQEFTPNTGAGKWDLTGFAGASTSRDTLGYGVLNLGPAPVPGGRVAFVSNRNGFLPTKGYTSVALQLFVMDEDGAERDADRADDTRQRHAPDDAA